jgi:tetratricopeptide (TPR) repeat protein
VPRVGPYETLEVLGRGGQGLVARARDVRTGAIVALKVVLDPRDPTIGPRLEREARALASLEHPNLARLVDSGTHEGRPWLALAFVQGRTLEAIGCAGRPPPAWSARVVADVAHALARCHAAGLVHRDVKPANIILEDVTERVVLVDFGLVRRDPRLAQSQPALTLSGELVGTPAYMAPEQADPRGHDAVGPPTDVHALGATLHFLLTGHPPYRGATLVELFARLLEQPPPAPSASAPGVPPPLDDLVRRALAKRPAERPTAAALAQALEALLAGAPGPAPPEGRRAGRRAGGGARGRPRPAAVALALAAIGLALAALAALAAATLRQAPGPAPAPPAPRPLPARPAPPWPAAPDGPLVWVWRRGDGPAPPREPALWESEAVAAPAALAAASEEGARAAFGGRARRAPGGRVAVRREPGDAEGLDPVWQVPGQAGLLAEGPLLRSTPDGLGLAQANDSGVGRVAVGRAVWTSPALRCRVRRRVEVDRELLALVLRPAAGAPYALTLEGRSRSATLKVAPDRVAATTAGLDPGWTLLTLAPGAPPGERLAVGGAGREVLGPLDAALGEPARDVPVALVLDEVDLLASGLEVEGVPRTVDRPALAGPATAPPGRVAAAFEREGGPGGPLVALEDAAGRRVTLGLDGGWLRLLREEGGRVEPIAEDEVGAGAEGWLWLEAGGGAVVGRARVGDREVDLAGADPWSGPWRAAAWGSSGPRVRLLDVEVSGPPAPDPPGAEGWRAGAAALAAVSCPRRLDAAALPPPGPGRAEAIADRARAAAARLEAFAAGLPGGGDDPAAAARLTPVRADALARAALGRALAGEPEAAERLWARLLAGAPAGVAYGRRALAALGPSAERGGPDLVDQLVVGWAPAAPAAVREACLALALLALPARRGDVLAQRGADEQARYRASGHRDRDALERALRLYAEGRAAGAHLGFVAPREAELLWRAGRLFEARQLYDAAVRLDPRGWSSWHGRAQVLLALGLREAALVSLLGALAANRSYPALAHEVEQAARADGVPAGVRAAALWALCVTVGQPGDLERLQASAREVDARGLAERDRDLLAFVLGEPPAAGARATATLARARRGDAAARAALSAAAEADELVLQLARLHHELSPLVR